MTRGPRLRGARRCATLPGVARLIRLFLHALTVLLIAQTSALAHTALDALSILAAPAAHAHRADAECEGEHPAPGHCGDAAPCPAQGDCDDCPEGCPTCHCANGPRVLAPGPALVLQHPEAPHGVQRPWVILAHPPDAPERTVYRPPRA